MSRKNRWWKPDKESINTLRQEADRLIGYDKTVNPSWKKRWKYFIKRQFPWYGIIELNQFKIIEMRDYMLHYSILAEEGIDKQVREMSEVIVLGNKILEDKYEDEAHKWWRENRCNITIVSKPTKDRSKRQELARLYNRDMFDDIISDTELHLDDPLSKEAFDRLKEFTKDKDTRSVDEWLKDNNLTKKDISTSYTSVWINGKSDEENEDELNRRFRDAREARKKDISEYFRLIGEYQYKWGD